MDIYRWARELGFTGYDGYTPDAIVRSNIHRWNKMVINAHTGGISCSEYNCNKKCVWGYEENKPSKCAMHKLDGMVKVVEERLVKHKKEPGASKGKFYFDENFAKRVFPNLPTTSEAKKDARSKPSNPFTNTIAPSFLTLNATEENEDEVDYEVDGEYEDDWDAEGTIQLNQKQPTATKNVLDDFATDILSSMNNGGDTVPSSFYPPHISLPPISTAPSMSPPSYQDQMWNTMSMSNQYNMWMFPMHWMCSMMMMMMNPHCHPMYMMQQVQRMQQMQQMQRMQRMQHVQQSKRSIGNDYFNKPCGHMPTNFQQNGSGAPSWRFPELGTSPSMDNRQFQHDRSAQEYVSENISKVPLIETNEPFVGEKNDHVGEFALTDVSSDAMFGIDNSLLGNPLLNDISLDFNDLFKDV